MTEASESGLFQRLQAALSPNYRLERELGRGGMGVVFDAVDLSLDRPVAIKAIHPELTQHEAIVRRFLAEAKMIAKLRHPNIVTVYAAGNADGLLYYVMDRVPGESVRARLQREGKLPIADARRIVRDVAAALEAAARAALVHRDVKPENILLESASGRALLVDFGVARAIASDPGVTSDTGRGIAVGTPSYMSPEQAAGEEVDACSDLYSLGVVGYELVAGHPPFEGTSRVIVSKHLSERPAPLQRHRPECPDQLADAIMKALEKNPADRWQSGAEFRAALDGTRRSPSRRSWLRASVAGGVLAVAVAGLALSAVSRDNAPPVDERRRSMLILPFHNLRGDSAITWMQNGSVEMLTLTLSEYNDLKIVTPQRVHDLMTGARLLDSAQVGAERAVSLARQAKVWTVVLGSFERTRDTLRLVARVVDVKTGAEVDRATVEEAFDDEVRPAYQRLAAQILNLSGTPRELRLGLTQATTTSIEAFRSYLAATDSLNHWNLVAAEQDYRRALARDSTFALAWFRLALTRGWLVGETDSIATDAINRATLFKDRLPTHEQAMVRAYAAFLSWRMQEARGIYDSLLARNPNDADAWYGLGDAWFHDTQIPEPANRFTPALRAFRRALAIDPGYALAFEHVQNVLAQASRIKPPYVLVNDSTIVPRYGANGRELDSASVALGIGRARQQAITLAREWVNSQPATARAHAALVSANLAAGDWNAADQEISRFRSVNPTSPEPPFDLARFHLARGDMDRAARELAPALDSLTDVDLDRIAGAPDIANRLAAAANVFAYRGNLARAARVIDIANRVRLGVVAAGSPQALDRDTWNWAMLGELYAAAGGPPAAMRRVWANALEASRSVPSPRRERVLSSGGAAAIGLFASPEADDDALDQFESLSSAPIAKEVRALRAIERQDPKAARRVLEEPDKEVAKGTMKERDGFTIFRKPIAAYVYLDLDEPQRTLDLLEGFEPQYLDAEHFDMRWGAVGRVRLLRAAAYEKLGQYEAAKEQYQLALDQWREADPDLMPYIQQAQAGLARLAGRG